MNYINSLKLLLEAIQRDGTATKVAVECQDERDVIFNTDSKGIEEALGYANEVDDVVSIRSFGKDVNDILGRFWIEPCNSELLNVVYDWTDNDYCNNIMKQLN